jgi:hypothetical protein
MLIMQMKMYCETIISLIWRDALWESEELHVASKANANLIHNVPEYDHLLGNG